MQDVREGGVEEEQEDGQRWKPVAPGRKLRASSSWLADHPPGYPAVPNQWGDGGCIAALQLAEVPAGPWEGDLGQETLVWLAVSHCDTAGLYLHKKASGIVVSLWKNFH